MSEMHFLCAIGVGLREEFSAFCDFGAVLFFVGAFLVGVHNAMILFGAFFVFDISLSVPMLCVIFSVVLIWGFAGWLSQNARLLNMGSLYGVIWG